MASSAEKIHIPKLGAQQFDMWIKRQTEVAVRGLLTMNTKHNTKVTQGLPVEQFEIPTAIWCGWIFSAIVFICEVIWTKVKPGRVAGKITSFNPKAKQTQLARCT